MAGTAQATDRDIDYLRQLAECGAHAPLLGGRFLVWWGLLLAIAYAAHHLALHRVIGDGNSVFAIIWMGFSILGVAGQFVLARGAGRKAGAGSAGNRASRVVWVAGACSTGPL